MNPQTQMERHDPPPPKSVATMAPKRPSQYPTQTKPKYKLLRVLALIIGVAITVYLFSS